MDVTPSGSLHLSNHPDRKSTESDMLSLGKQLGERKTLPHPSFQEVSQPVGQICTAT